jgi:hypothetical protein
MTPFFYWSGIVLAKFVGLPAHLSEAHISSLNFAYLVSSRSCLFSALGRKVRVLPEGRS